MDGHVVYEYRDGMVSSVLYSGYSDTHEKALVAIIGELVSADLIDNETLIQIEIKIHEIRQEKGVI